MAKTAAEYLDELARQELVPPHIVASLRLQVGQATKPVSAATIARLLVEKKHLTATQAERLLGAPLSAPAATSAPMKAVSQAPSPLAETKPMEPDELGLAPLDDRHAAGDKASPPRQPAQLPDEPLDLELLDLVPLDDAPVTATSQPAAAKPSGDPRPRPSVVKPTKSANQRVPAVGQQSRPPPGSAAAGLTPLVPLPLDALQPLDALPPIDALVPLEVAPQAAPVPAQIPKPASSHTAAGASRQAPVARRPPEVAAPSSAQPATVGLGPAGLATPGAPPARSRVPWLALGIGALSILLLAGGISALLLLPRGTGDKEFELAHQEYQSKQYLAASERYSKLLKSFPRYRHAGQARVRGGMARILAAKGTGENWSAVLPAARQVLSEIDREPELAEVHVELAPLLTDMATGLLKQAQETSPAEISGVIKEAREALALADNGRYVPGSLRNWQRLAEAEDALALLERKQSAETALAQSTVAAQQALDGGDVGKAYAECDKLLAIYPELAGDAKLTSLMGESTRVAKTSVLAVSKLGKAQTAERTTPVIGKVTLVHAPIAAAPGPAGTFLAQAGGSIWGLDAAMGKVLWGRHIGDGARFAPVSVSADDRSNVLLVDARNDEVLCIQQQTGVLAWRHALEAGIVGSPVVIGQRVFVTSRDGRVTALDAKNGDAVVAVQLPSSANTAAIASADGQRLYQLADRHLLYVLAADDLKCQGAIYLGHERGSVAVPPVLLNGRLVVADNHGIDHSVLHVIPLDTAGLPKIDVQVTNMPGLVLTPPVLVPQRLLVLTDRATTMLDVSPDATEPLKQATDTGSQASLPLLRFGLAIGSRLCTADVGLRRIDVTPAEGLKKLAWVSFAQDVFETPPQAIGDVILCVRRAPGRPGWIAAAVKSGDGSPLWETPLGVPISHFSVSSDKSVQAVTMLGGVGTFELSDMQAASAHKILAVAAGPKERPITDSVALSGGGTLLIPAGQPRELLLVDAEGKQPRSIPLLDPVGGIPAAGTGGCLVPSSSGAVYWLADGGTLSAAPFQLRMAAGERLEHCSAVSVGDDGQRFVVSDGKETLYHLALETEPQPHLAALATTRLELPPISPIAAIGEHVYVVDRAGNLRSFDLPDLKPAISQPLAAREIVSGPHRVGEALCLATDRQELVCIKVDGSIQWRAPLHDGLLAGSPIESAGNLIVATKGGAILRLAADSGQELARSEVKQPLFGTPVAIGSEVLVSTADGNMLKISLPEKEAAGP